MTNTLNTPIEAIEREFPLRVTRYEIAEGTGGAGHYRGGNGLFRSLQLLEGTGHATLLSDRHAQGAPGAQGGSPGSRGRHTLLRGGNETELAAKVSLRFEPGDVLTVQTPGGGGFGASEWSVAARGRGAFEPETRGDEQVDDSDRAAPR